MGGAARGDGNVVTGVLVSVGVVDDGGGVTVVLVVGVECAGECVG